MTRLLSGLAFGLPLAMACLSLPLALGMVGPNSIYGYRTAASLSSSAAWYAANETAGWCGVAFSALAFLLTLCLVRWNVTLIHNPYVTSILAFSGLMLVSALVQYGLNG